MTELTVFVGLIAVVLVVVVGLIIRGERCDDGRHHEWQVWVPYAPDVQSRTCLKCGLEIRRRVRTDV